MVGKTSGKKREDSKGGHARKAETHPERRIDLNLMNVLYAVLAEGSVTRAAQRLSMTQPAVSNALRRLRYIMKDELFLKTPGGINPTEKALELWPALQQAMDQIRAIAVPEDFLPAETRLAFNVALTDTLVSRVVPALVTRFAMEAPLAKLQFHLHSNPASIASLERGGLDCAVGMFPTVDADLRLEGVFSDTYVCAYREGHSTLSSPMTLEAFIGAKHVLVKQATRQAGIVDTWLSLKGYERNIPLIVNRAEEAINIARQTDFVATVPLSFVQSISDADRLQVTELPFENERILYKMAWHKRTDRDPARSWLRAMIRSTIDKTCAQKIIGNQMID